MKQAPVLVETARAIRYKPLEAEALALLGQVFTNARNPEMAEKTLTDAYQAADASRHDEVRAEVSTALVFVTGELQGRFEEAMRWSGVANAVLQRLGGHDLLRAWLLNNVGCVDSGHHDKDAAIRVISEASALKQRILGPDSADVAVSEANLGNILEEMGRFEEALVHMDRALAIEKKRLGTYHPTVAMNLNNRAEILMGLKRYAEAREYFGKAKAIWERELGPDATVVGVSLDGNRNQFHRRGAAGQRRRAPSARVVDSIGNRSRFGRSSRSRIRARASPVGVGPESGGCQTLGR